MIEDGEEIPRPISLDDYAGQSETDLALPIMLIEGPIAAPA